MTNPSSLSSKFILGQITVRLLHDTERARFDELLEHRHYLNSARVGGRSIRYVAELNGEWIALICFSGAAPHLAGREEWIGWSPTQLARRLGFVVNNSRYLLLTDRQVYPNMGSKVLSLCLKRLSADWEQVWNQPVLIVESFVDEHLGYEGTCYKACGFEAVGPSAGYGRSSRDYYVKHDRPKQLYLRALDKRARKWLSQARMPAALAAHELDRTGPCPFKAEALGSLLELFKNFKDERRGHGLLHRQSFVLACAAVGMLMGADSYSGLEDKTGKLDQRQLRALGARKDQKTGRYRAPSDSTFFRVLGMVDAAAFDSTIGQWMSLRELDTLKRIAVDGKTLRGSKRGEDGKALQLLSAVTHQLRLTISQREIEEKSNEIPALIPLLESIPRLEGSLVSADAIQCQQEGCGYITQQRGADYLIGLKGNQSGILARAELKLPREFFSCGHDSGWVKEHGRLQRWRIQRKCVSPEEAGLCGCRQFVAVWRERKYLRGGRVYKEEEEYSFYVSSADPRVYDEAALLDIIRGHWDGIENGSHHRRDVSMGEDASGISKRTQAHMMASLRNLTLGLFERHKHQEKKRVSILEA